MFSGGKHHGSIEIMNEMALERIVICSYVLHFSSFVFRWLHICFLFYFKQMYLLSAILQFRCSIIELSIVNNNILVTESYWTTHGWSKVQVYRTLKGILLHYCMICNYTAAFRHLSIIVYYAWIYRCLFSCFN